MAVVVQCPHCNQQGEVSRTAVDKDVTCASCKQRFHVPIGAGHLTVEWGVGMTGQRVLLRPPDPVRIGRATDNELGLPGEQVSRNHAAIRWENGEWRLHDLDSANGTIVLGERIKDVPLSDGMRFVIGDFSIRIALAMPPTDERKALDALAAQESVYGGPDTALKPVAPSETPSRIFGPRDASSDTTYAAPGIRNTPTMDASARAKPKPQNAAVRSQVSTPAMPSASRPSSPQRHRGPIILMLLIMIVVIAMVFVFALR